LNFSERKTTRKGAFGEAIVDKHMIAKGKIPYRPILDVAHPFDRLFATLDKKTVFIGDTKSKPAREYYPDTGFDVCHWLIYKYAYFHHNLDTYMAFVDEKRCKVYGQFLSILDVRRCIRVQGKGDLWYPRTEHYKAGEIRYFPLAIMELVGDLSDEESSQLKNLSTRNPKYDEQFEMPLGESAWAKMWSKPYDKPEHIAGNGDPHNYRRGRS
jgi:hypothetical protein